MNDLIDLIYQVDLREGVAIGSGTIVGVIHAVHDKLKNKIPNSSLNLVGMVSAFNAAQSSGYDSNFGRSLIDAGIGILAYESSYLITSKVLNGIYKIQEKN